MIKTSKIQEIHQMKPWNGPNGTIVYHHLLMENGDMIDIGKKKEMKVGWEITYSLTGDPGQHKYTKAKAERKPEEQFKPQKRDFDDTGIKVGHAINNAVQLHGESSDPDWYVIADYARRILTISKELEAEVRGESKPVTAETPIHHLEPETEDDGLPF